MMITKEKIEKAFREWRNNKRYSTEPVPMHLISMIFQFREEGGNIQDLIKRLKISPLTYRRIQKHFEKLQVSFVEERETVAISDRCELTSKDSGPKAETREPTMPSEFIKINSVDEFLGEIRKNHGNEEKLSDEKLASTHSWRVKIFRGGGFESDGFSLEGQGASLPHSLLLDTLTLWLASSSASFSEEDVECKH